MIVVGKCPTSMVILGDFGYVTESGPDTLSVIDLKTNVLIQTIPVGSWPVSMVIYGELGYVVNRASLNLAVIDLNSRSVTQRIDMGQTPRSMVIYADFGYVANMNSHNVYVIDLKTNWVIKAIPVGLWPQSMVIYGEFGYVTNWNSHNVSVINCKTNSVSQTIAVGECPCSMVIHEDLGYVPNHLSRSISVIDFKTQSVTKTIPLEQSPKFLSIRDGVGYVSYVYSETISVIDLNTHRVFRTYNNPHEHSIDFSDTHVYLGVTKLEPLYPNLKSLTKMRVENRLNDFVTMNPKVFEVGEIKPRDYPKEENGFDEMPPYVLAQDIFWDLESGEPIIDPIDILATLTTMKYPQKFLKTEAGRWLRDRLHRIFFQAVWLEQNEKAQEMLKYYIQLKDPVILSLTPNLIINEQGTLNSSKRRRIQ